MTDHPPPSRAFPEAARRAVYDVIAARRDVRNFRPDPVPDAVLARILDAAHRAASVGYMQPWDFILVRSAERKAAVYELFRRANDRAATRFADDRRTTYLALKLQGVLEAPLSICVTCDTRRGGPHVLGRDTIRETDVYSTCLAVQNLWLAARAEGVGVGWVSIVENVELSALLGLPEGVVPVAFLCVGYPVEFATTPMLAASGWAARLPLGDLLHEDTWGTRAPALTPGDPPAATVERARSGITQPGPTLAALVARVRPADADGARRARVAARLDALAKPRGSLGQLEALAVRLACAQGCDHPAADDRRVYVFAGDHGVVAQGVSAYAPDVTTKLCYAYMAGGGVVNAFARQAGARLTVVDVGVDHDFGAATGLRRAKLARGTRNLADEPAMTPAEVHAAVEAGAAALLDGGTGDVVALGEVGIGNSTAAAAVLALLTGADPAACVGRGTGVGDDTLRRKCDAVARAVARAGVGVGRGGAPPCAPLEALMEAGGFELAALAGAVLAAAGRRVPVVLDGFMAGVAALVAVRLAPAAADYLVAAHRSAEQAHGLVLEQLGLEPLLALDLRLGEASGAVLALPLVQAACALLRDVRTFAETGIEPPVDPRGMR